MLGRCCQGALLLCPTTSSGSRCLLWVCNSTARLCNTPWGPCPRGGWGLRHKHCPLPHVLTAVFPLCSAVSQDTANHCHFITGCWDFAQQGAVSYMTFGDRELHASTCVLSLARHCKMGSWKLLHGLNFQGRSLPC